MKLGKYDFVNEEEVLKLLPELDKFEGELPWVLMDYINIHSYFNRVSDEVVTGFYDRKHDISIVENPLEYIEYDLKVWVTENPEYETIYINTYEEEEGLI